MNHRHPILAALLAAALGLGACAQAPVAADAPGLPRFDQALRQASPAMPVTLRVAPEPLRAGQPLALEVGASGGGYLYLFQLGTDGRSTSLVFPNAMDGANFVRPGGRVTLPREGWSMTARGPAGLAYLLAVVSEKPQDLLAVHAAASQGRLALAGGYGAALASYREVAP